MFDCDHYYVCIFAKTAATSPRLLFRGPQCFEPDQAINEFLQMQAEEISNMVSDAAHVSQMSKEQWREPYDHTVDWTVCESKHAVPEGWNERYASNSAYPESAASAAQQDGAGKQDGPPAYKK